MFPYHFKTNRMLFPDKSSRFFWDKSLAIAPKNFIILTQKIQPVEEWKDTGVYCQYYTAPWLYIHPFVYTTMKNFSAIFKHKKLIVEVPNFLILC